MGLQARTMNKEGEQRPSQQQEIQPQQGRAEGRQSLQGITTIDRSAQRPSSPTLPFTPQEHPTLPQKSALNRAVEQTRVLYERGGGFLPLGEAGRHSPNLPSPQTEQAPHDEDSNRPEIVPSKNETSDTDDFWDMITRATASPPLSEDFYQRMRERLRRNFQEPKEEPERPLQDEGIDRGSLESSEETSELTRENEEW